MVTIAYVVKILLLSTVCSEIRIHAERNIGTGVDFPHSILHLKGTHLQLKSSGKFYSYFFSLCVRIVKVFAEETYTPRCLLLALAWHYGDDCRLRWCMTNTFQQGYSE